MRIVRFDGGKTGLVIGDDALRIVDVAASVDELARIDASAARMIKRVLPPAPGASWVEMIRQWDMVRDAFQSLLTLAGSDQPHGLTLVDFDAATLEPPLASPGTHIFAIASNTSAHIIKAFKVLLDKDLTEDDTRKAQRAGTPPLGFMLWSSIFVGDGATITPPRGTRKLDYEAECAVYVKQGGRYLDDVSLWGYTAFNDLGVRDTHLGLQPEAPHGPFAFNVPKNFDSGKSCGPWVVVDEVDDLDTLRCILTVNGEVRQDWGLSEMIYGFDETLRFLSHNMTLQPGDMLASGTGAGVAFEGGLDGPYLQPGDVIEVKLDGAGTLRNTVGAW